MDRKNFIKTSCTLCGLGIIGAATFLESCKKNNATKTTKSTNVNFSLDLAQTANSDLNTIGGSIASNGVIIVNSGSNSFVALAQTCTHEGCDVEFNKTGNNFICPCHHGVFDINGNVTSGPPPTALKKYSVVKNGNILTITS